MGSSVPRVQDLNEMWDSYDAEEFVPSTQLDDVDMFANETPHSPSACNYSVLEAANIHPPSAMPTVLPCSNLSISQQPTLVGGMASCLGVHTPHLSNPVISPTNRNPRTNPPLPRPFAFPSPPFSFPLQHSFVRGDPPLVSTPMSSGVLPTTRRTMSQPIPSHIMHNDAQFPNVSLEDTLDAAPSDSNESPSLVLDDTQSQPSSQGRKPPREGRSIWRLHEIIALIESKKEIEMRKASGGLCARIRRDRWQEISDMCRKVGVVRTDKQCLDKWEKINAAFHRIQDYERLAPSGRSSYWAMTTAERKAADLPHEDFKQEIYNRMLDLFAGDRVVDPSTIILESTTEDASATQEEHETNTGQGTPNPIPRTSNNTPARAENESASESNVAEGPGQGIPRKKAKRASGTLNDLVATSKNLVSMFQDCETSRADRFAIAEANKERRESTLLARQEALEKARLDLHRENTQAVSTALHHIAESIANMNVQFRNDGA